MNGGCIGNTKRSRGLASTNIMPVLQSLQRPVDFSRGGLAYYDALRFGEAPGLGSWPGLPPGRSGITAGSSFTASALSRNGSPKKITRH